MSSLSAKHNSTMEKVMGLISSFLDHDIASSRDVPFCQMQQLHSIHHGATFVLFCVPVFVADNARYQCVLVQNGFPMALSCFSRAFSEANWIHFREVFHLIVALCNEWCIATNEAQ